MRYDRIERNEIARCCENFGESLSVRSAPGARPSSSPALRIFGPHGLFDTGGRLLRRCCSPFGEGCVALTGLCLRSWARHPDAEEDQGAAESLDRRQRLAENRPAEHG